MESATTNLKQKEEAARKAMASLSEQAARQLHHLQQKHHLLEQHYLSVNGKQAKQAVVTRVSPATPVAN